MENAVRGFLAVRKAFRPFIKQELEQAPKQVIAEASFVSPQTLAILVINSDDKLHYSNFFVHRKHSKETDEQFVAARYIQEYLIDEAKQNNFIIVDNIGDIKSNLVELLTKAKFSG